MIVYDALLFNHVFNTGPILGHLKQCGDSRE